MNNLNETANVENKPDGSESQLSELLCSESKFAIHSKKMAELSGEVVWKRRNGEKVICTAVGDTPNCGAMWDDIEHLWMVSEFVERISEGEVQRSRRTLGIDSVYNYIAA